MSVTGVDPLLLVIVIVVGTVDTGEDGRLTSKGPFELQVKVEAGFLEMRLSLKRLACQDPRKESLCHVVKPWRMPSETVTRYQQTRLEDSKKEKISLLSFCVTLCVYIKEDVELIIITFGRIQIILVTIGTPSLLSSRPY